MLRILLLRSSVLADVQKGASSSLPPAKSSTAKLEERLHREVRELCLSAVHASLDEMHQALFKVDEFPAWHCLHGKPRVSQNPQRELTPRSSGVRFCNGSHCSCPLPQPRRQL